MAGPETGVQVTCPGCGATVLQKAMIPIAGFTDGASALGYLCVGCARRHVDVRDAGAGAAADEPAAEEPEEDAAPV